MVQAQGPILALDLASSTGVCLAKHGAICYASQLDLGRHRVKAAGGKERWEPSPLGRRCAVLMSYLDTVAGNDPTVQVAYEEVCRWSGFQAAHIYCALRGLVHQWAYARDRTLYPYSVGTIKKSATGKGNADKNAMIRAAQEKWPLATGHHGDKFTDNMADAMHIADLHWRTHHADQGLRDTTHI